MNQSKLIEPKPSQHDQIATSKCSEAAIQQLPY